MNTACDLHEQNLSAVLDGETATVDLPATLDHLVDCPSCAAFYRRSRDLEAAIAAAEMPGEDPGEVPDGVWERIRERAPFTGASLRSSRWFEWAPRIAAVLLLAFGVWMLRAVDGGPDLRAPRPAESPGEAPQAIEVEVGEADMTEKRFVEITAEVLRADTRYHRKMLEVMETVTRPGVREGSPDEGSDDERGEGEGDRISLGDTDRTLDVREWRF